MSICLIKTSRAAETEGTLAAPGGICMKMGPKLKSLPSCVYRKMQTHPVSTSTGLQSPSIVRLMLEQMTRKLLY